MPKNRVLRETDPFLISYHIFGKTLSPYVFVWRFRWMKLSACETPKLHDRFLRNKCQNYRYSLPDFDKILEGSIPPDTSRNFISLKGHIKSVVGYRYFRRWIWDICATSNLEQGPTPLARSIDSTWPHGYLAEGVVLTYGLHVQQPHYTCVLSKHSGNIML